MSTIRVPRARTMLLTVLALCCLVFAGQVAWLQQVGSGYTSPWLIGLFGLAPLGACIAFLGLWHLSLRQRGKRVAAAAVPFWLVSALLLLFWFGFYSTFVIGPALDAAA